MLVLPKQDMKRDYSHTETQDYHGQFRCDLKNFVSVVFHQNLLDLLNVRHGPTLAPILERLNFQDLAGLLIQPQLAGLFALFDLVGRFGFRFPVQDTVNH